MGYLFKDDALYLGLDRETGFELGVQTERNAITIAGAGGGKGTCLIIPNLMRWPFAALVIDPKGENAEETWQAREALGQRVGVLDPFKVAKVPDRLRVSVNPLVVAGQPDVRPSREDILAVADGIVKRTDPKAAQWDDGARTIIAGAVAFVAENAPPHVRTLAEARRLLIQPEVRPAGPDGKPRGLKADAEEMASSAGLAKAAGVSILTALTKGRGADSEYLSGARRHSEWLDSRDIEAAINASTFPLGELATGKATLFVVLPYDKMEVYSAFLRMIVRTAQNTIANAGNKRGPDQRCLFILDEFFTLGRLDEVQKAAGNMRSYGLQLWPFLQDYGQLAELYGERGAETFFANADAQIYFANTDTLTLTRVSNQLETTLPQEIMENPPTRTPFAEKMYSVFLWRWPWESKEYARERHKVKQRNALEESIAANADRMEAYHHQMKQAGNARFTPNKVASLVGRGNDDKVARAAIVFAKGGDVLEVKIAPFFAYKLKPPPTGIDLIAHSSVENMYNEFYGRAKRSNHPVGYLVFGIREFCGNLWFDIRHRRNIGFQVAVVGIIAAYIAAVLHFDHGAVTYIPLALVAAYLTWLGWHNVKYNLATRGGRHPDDADKPW